MTSILAGNLPPKGGWNITGQSTSTKFVPGRAAPVDGYVVNFVTGYGTNGSVFVPTNEYTPDTVKAAITAQVAALDAVNQLTHDS